MCVLRVSSNRKTLTDFLSGSRIPYYDTHDKSTPQKFGREKGKPFGHTGFKSAVSEKEWDDLPGQFADAIRFLQRYKADLMQLRREFKVRDLTLDFPYHLRIGRNNVAVQGDFLPPKLISLAGELGIGIGMTLYPAPSPVRKSKGKGNPKSSAATPPDKEQSTSKVPKTK
jgi:hypothetical protein